MGAERTRGQDVNKAGSTARDTSDGNKLPCITAVRCSPDRTVFTVDDNNNGWISTDTTVDIER